MADPLTEIVTLLHPTARFSKRLEGAGHWRIEREGQGDPFYAAVLQGQCRLSVDAGPPVILQAGDFVLAPAVHTLVNTSLHAPPDTPASLPVHLGENQFRIGTPDGPAELHMQIGHCQFGSPDAALLVPLLPQLVRVRGQARLAALVQMVGEESRAQRPGRDVVLERLLDVLLIEALRSQSGPADGGLVRGLADERLAGALRSMHARPGHGWSVAGLAQEAALSRSAFSARFTRVLGIAPMEYLLTWRMALAKRLLRAGGLGLEQVAERVGYASAETFSVAFARHAGMSPARFLRHA
ncbi:AraC family transcriptional regulator [Stenotrophomonas sp. 24(2023)]|uniref:AraC family transcriptional regulator n=1 Tax=Stenotrophomonas sp. 24(2023) TaxID=3068324 RepID=UPI0027E1D0B8|nr:AraC family transcriptional regulator [Stenotrophomonas sp. 24(2023)]WMJ69234.1 AraC family transcriptional regulator [Stenotrophomonas sp. 24(2023)]